MILVGPIHADVAVIALEHRSAIETPESFTGPDGIGLPDAIVELLQHVVDQRHVAGAVRQRDRGRAIAQDRA